MNRIQLPETVHFQEVASAGNYSKTFSVPAGELWIIWLASVGNETTSGKIAKVSIEDPSGFQYTLKEGILQLIGTNSLSCEFVGRFPVRGQAKIHLKVWNCEASDVINSRLSYSKVEGGLIGFST